VTLNSPTETKQTLTVDQWYEVSFMIEDKEAAQVKKSYNTHSATRRTQPSRPAKKLEVAIATLFTGFSTTKGTRPSLLPTRLCAPASRPLRRPMPTSRKQHGSSTEDRVGNPSFRSTVFALPKLNTNVADPVVKGAIGLIYGRPVVTSTLITKINTNADYAGALAVPDSSLATSPFRGSATRWVSACSPITFLNISARLPRQTSSNGVIENRDAGGVRDSVSGVVCFAGERRLKALPKPLSQQQYGDCNQTENKHHPQTTSIAKARNTIGTKINSREQSPYWKGGRGKHHGYTRVNLGTDANPTTFMNIDLVMEAHLVEHYFPTESCTSINGKKSDNRIENLQVLHREEHKQSLPVSCPKMFTPIHSLTSPWPTTSSYNRCQH